MAGKFFAVAGSPWNNPLPTDVPIHPDNDALTADLFRQEEAANQPGRWGLARNRWGVALYEVWDSQTRVPVTLLNGTTPYPQALDGNPGHELAYRLANRGVQIPRGAVPARGNDDGTGDHHLAVVQKSGGEFVELWKAVQAADGSWTAKWGGTMPDHRKSIGQFRNETTSIRMFKDWASTASSLPAMAGLILQAEIDAGVIPHALQCVLPDPLSYGWVWPAQRNDGWNGLIPEGSRFRLKPTVDVPSYTGVNETATRTLRMIATALQTYGAVIVDRNAINNPISFRAQQNLAVTDAVTWGDDNWRLLRKLTAGDMQFIAPDFRP